MTGSDGATARPAVADVVMTWRSGPDMGCTDFSESWLAFAGRTVEEELGYGWADRVHPDDLARCLGTYQSAFALRREFQMEYRLRRHDGVYRWILDIGTPESSGEDGFLGYVGTCIDITEPRGSREVATEDSPILASEPTRRTETLTRREQQVAALLIRGLSNDQIAEQLTISVATVRVHVEHILAKLGVHSRAQVVAQLLTERF
jgi:PAS domain S-box-containing protein